MKLLILGCGFRLLERYRLRDSLYAIRLRSV